MSRFNGWSEAAVAKLSGKITETDCRESMVKKNLLIKISSDYVGKIQKAIEFILGLRCEREYKFLHDRRFRFDLAIPEKNIAIEFEGGVWTRGRHVRGKGYVNDCKKYNLAVMYGWRLLRYTTEDTKKINWTSSVVEDVRKMIGVNV